MAKRKASCANGWVAAHRYLEGKARLLYPEPEDVFPCDLIDADHCRPPSSYV
jgi:glucose-6-phosphate isomerase